MQLHNPLYPNYDFDAHLVAGITPIEFNSELDFVIDRPNGMKGFIINLTTKGRGTVFCNENQFDVGVGDILLFPAGINHYYHRHKEESSWYHRWIYFRPRGYWSKLLSWKNNKNGVFITKNISSEQFKLCNSLFEDIAALSKSEDRYSSDLATNQLERLLIQCKMIQPDQALKPLDPRILQIISYMMDDISKEYTNEELASKVYLSHSRLAHLFRKEMGMTVTQWRDDQRTNYAKQLLTNSSIPINKISRMVGYSDPLYFSRIFKKYSGVSPRAYRCSCPNGLCSAK